jgi:hypothetical protein
MVHSNMKIDFFFSEMSALLPTYNSLSNFALCRYLTSRADSCARQLLAKLENTVIQLAPGHHHDRWIVQRQPTFHPTRSATWLTCY